MDEAEVGAGGDQGVVERELVGGIDVDLEAELARERNPRHQRGHRRDVDRPDVEEREGGGGQILIGEPCEQLPRARPGEHEA